MESCTWRKSEQSLQNGRPVSDEDLGGWRRSTKIFCLEDACCWETFYIFAYRGLVVESNHLTAKISESLLPFQGQPRFGKVGTHGLAPMA